MDKAKFLGLAQKAHGDKYGYEAVPENMTRRDKVSIVCPEHGVFVQQVATHINGSRCPECAKVSRLVKSAKRAVPLEVFVARARAAHGDRYTYTNVVYRNKDTKVAITCPEHGDFMQTPASHAGGHGCPRCFNLVRGQSGKIDPEVWVVQQSARHPGVDFSESVYKGAHVLVTARCLVHGDITRKAMKWATSGCPKCGKERSAAAPRSTEALAAYNARHSKEAEKDFWAFAKANAGRFDFSLAVYRGVNVPLTVICREHGPFAPIPNNLIRGHGCIECGNEAISAAKVLSVGEVLERFAVTHGDKYDYSKVVYINGGTDVEIVCRQHGSFFQNIHNHAAGAGCPVCGKNTSYGEYALRQWLEALGESVVPRARNIIPPKEIDIWLPERRLGVEYHGLYWHTTDRVADIHREKWERAEAAGVRVIQVFEDEWLGAPDVVKSRLLALLGRASKVGARKCTVEDIAPAEARGFLEATHTQRAGPPAQRYLALKHQDRVVAVASFGKRKASTMAAGGDWEVLRYASEGVVVGGFSKLFSAFVKAESVSRAVSYCDLRYGSGGMYAAAGFSLEGVTDPDYWWVPRGADYRVARYQTQKHKLKNHPILGPFYKETMTENEICAAAGWKKILGVGSQKWVWTKSKNPAILPPPKPLIL